MAPRTLTSTWKNFEKLIRQYEKSDRTDEKKLDAIDELVSKTNNSRIVEALTTLFVRPYGLEDVHVRFANRENDSFPDWYTHHDEEGGFLYVNVMGVFDFMKECMEAVERLKTPEARKSFKEYRFCAYLAQMSKLSSKFTLFLLILREVAAIRHITDVEKKGGEVEQAAGERYLQLLWAFKELEAFFRRTNGLDLRAEFGVLWLESDWFIGQ